MTSRNSCIAVSALLCLIAWGGFSQSAIAACSESKIKDLGDQGRTVTSIANVCDMSASEVRSILENDSGFEDDSDPSDDEGRRSSRRRSPPTALPSGTSLSQCGCWGNVYPGYQQPHPRCESGYAVAVACPIACPTGGYAWRGVCG